MTKLSIIIVNYRTGPLTKALVESLLTQELPQKTEIIVVDNNSGDNSVLLLRSDFPEITVIDNPENIGLAAGVNKALAQAKGEYYLILNPDMIALPGSVSTLIDFMETHQEVGMAGGKLLSPNGQLQYSCYRFYKPMTIVYRRTWLGKTVKGRLETSKFLMKDIDHNRAQEVDWLMGACLAIRAKALKEVGGMDEQFFLYFEDVDWCRRFWQAGWKVMYVPQAQFSHFHQRSSERGALLGILTNRATRAHIASAIKYFWKFRGQKNPRST
jgi:GT2 family glycosyltransferase